MKSQQLQESINGILDEVVAINASIEKEGREAKAEETARIAELIGDDGASGKLAKLKASKAQAESFERELTAARAARMVPGGVHHEQAGIADSSSIFSRIKVPARAKARAPVTAFLDFLGGEADDAAALGVPPTRVFTTTDWGAVASAIDQWQSPWHSKRHSEAVRSALGAPLRARSSG